MKTRRIVALLLLAIGGVSVWALNRRGASGEITPRPLLYLVADTQREIERIPLELTRVTDQRENEIGSELARSEGLRPAPPLKRSAEETRIEVYLNAVGRGITAHVKRTAISYRIYYIPQDYFVNAAAMPGGQIVFGRGLLRLLDSEDELAAILGHEIAHVDERHAIERLQYEMKARQLGLGGIYSLGEPAIHLFQAGYTKEQEADADRIGLEFAVATGYSPGGALSAMRKLEALEPKPGAHAESPGEELAGVPLQALEEYFRSHPPTSERISAFEKEIADKHWNAGLPQESLKVRTIFMTEQAAALDRQGEFAKAAARFREAIHDDPSYQPARRGLAFALWRSGDAGATIPAVNGALLGDTKDDTALWHLFALALAGSACADAPHQFSVAFSATAFGSPFTKAFVNDEESGLKLLCGKEADQAIREYNTRIVQEPGVSHNAELRISMAAWMYRAGRLDEALKELDAAHQQSPSTSATGLARTWVLIDLGRQADALSSLEGATGDDAERKAASALVHWRTEQRDLAKQEFARAAQSDPVWMETHWAEHNYSAKAAAVFAQLRAAEIARRKEEEAKKRRAALTGGATPR
jgi:predicted Zn-dependent protease